MAAHRMLAPRLLLLFLCLLPGVAADAHAQAGGGTAGGSGPASADDSNEYRIEAPAAEEAAAEVGESSGFATEMDAGEAQAADAAGGQSAGLSPRTRTEVEQIVVSARKRSELLEETPVSVTALGAETLIAAGVTRIDQIQNLVPNLTILGDPSGQLGSFIIRGVTNFPFVFFDQGVGVYVDGVFFPRNAGNLLDVVDVAQIEVLRGPQGTLFGKNTVGGAVNITTVQPHDELEGYAFMRAGSFGTFDTRATLNVPVAAGHFEDRLFTRFSFGSFQDEGYTVNTLRDETATDRSSLSFIGSVRYLPADDVSVLVYGSWERSHTRGPGGQCVFIQDVATSVFLPPGYREACEASEPFSFAADTHSVSDLESYGTWGNVEWDVGDLGPLENLVVKATAAWREQIPSVRSDWDMTGFPVFKQAQIGGARTTASPAFSSRPSKSCR
ncbi:MAG: hypothetical protein FJ144_12230 [Deltaproteobacteria bacterium]|nr:hypothetical protein [Deltaproteobacteria bacterium]